MIHVTILHVGFYVILMSFEFWCFFLVPKKFPSENRCNTQYEREWVKIGKKIRVMHKGQLNLEWIYDITVSPKNTVKEGGGQKLGKDKRNA